jgi:uncharacterized NAD(P)/FAD-binding protein YdhS
VSVVNKTQRIAVIGGGASGVIVAANLVRAMSGRADIVLVERRPQLGQGLAYSTSEPTHLLNVRAFNMSAFPDEPDHFVIWLQQHGPMLGIGSPTRFCFVPRIVYGAYIASLLHEDAADGVRVLRDDCIDLAEESDGVRLGFASGGTLKADIALLATGHDVRSAAELGQAAINPWAPGALDGFDAESPLLLVGTGLTMVDVVLSLNRRGHRGRVVALSRRGLRPATHRAVRTVELERGEVPFATPVSQLMRWLRDFVASVEAEGADWRSAIDALRPYTRSIWQAMTADERRRFLRHARPWWDVHRHRMAPAISEKIDNLLAEDRLSIVAARVLTTEPRKNGFVVRLRRRGSARDETLEVASIIDCSGLPDDPRRSTNGVIRSLFARGLARTDALAIGLDVADDGGVIDACGKPSQRVFAVGPLARGAFWEMVAIPDIRTQCAELADRIARRRAAQPAPA